MPWPRSSSTWRSPSGRRRRPACCWSGAWDCWLADRPAEAAKILRRGLGPKPPQADQPAFSLYLAGAWRLVRPHRRGPGRRPQGGRACGRTRRGFPAACPGSSIAKRYDEAIASYRALLARFDGPPPRMQELLRARSAVRRRDAPAGRRCLAVATIDDDRWPETRDILREAVRAFRPVRPETADARGRRVAPAGVGRVSRRRFAPTTTWATCGPIRANASSGR